MNGFNQLAEVVQTYQTSGSQDFSASSAEANDFLSGFFIVSLITFVVFYLIISFLLYRVFKKAGRHGWEGFVPFYNSWVLFEISGKPGWWVLLGLIPFVGWTVLAVLSLIAVLELAKRFNKSPVFAILALWLFSIVGYAILAFDKSQYQVSGQAPGNQPPNTGPPPAQPDQSNSTPTTPQQQPTVTPYSPTPDQNTTAQPQNQTPDDQQNTPPPTNLVQ